MSIEKDVADFLAKGGKIQQIPIGAMAHNTPELRNSLADMRKREYTLRKEREAMEKK